MSDSLTTWKVAGGFFFVLSILSLLFGFTMWFLVPPDPMGNIYGVTNAKAEWALVGIVVAAVMFFLARYSFRKAIHERSGT
jgi:nitrate reductase gamma subunit